MVGIECNDAANITSRRSGSDRGGIEYDSAAF